MKLARTIVTTMIVLLALLVPVPRLYSAVAPSSLEGTLSTDQVVDNLVHESEERVRALQHSEATRVYHLVYRGLFGHREAEMIVRASYDTPSTKHFQIVSQSGSKIILRRVFKKLLDSEEEAAQPSVRAQTLLNRANYDFDLIEVEHSTGTLQYVLQVCPKSRSKYVYRGKVWVDGTDFAVTRIEAEPSKNPSFWTRKVEIHHEYKKDPGLLASGSERIGHLCPAGRTSHSDHRLQRLQRDRLAASRRRAQPVISSSNTSYALCSPHMNDCPASSQCIPLGLWHNAPANLSSWRSVIRCGTATVGSSR